MPQMSPLYWLFLYMYMLLIVMIIMIIFYYFYIKENLEDKLIKKENKNFKWMW